MRRKPPEQEYDDLSRLSGMHYCVAMAVLLGFAAAASSGEDRRVSLPGSDKTYTERQINDPFSAPNWFPDAIPPMPAIVQYGAKPTAFACASCHLTTGSGHPESASLAALPVDYHVRQMQAYQRFERPSVAGVMINIARGMTDEQIVQAAEYFASLAPLAVQEVVETDEVPVTYVNSRFMRLIDRNAVPAREPIGERLITLPKDEPRVLARDPFGTFIVYVPKGYLAIGEQIVRQGRDGTAPCTSCHGPDLRGTAIAPLIAGQHADYLVAQLRDYKQGKRRGAADPGGVMANNLKFFEDSEILATAAYIASLSRQ